MGFTLGCQRTRARSYIKPHLQRVDGYWNCATYGGPVGSGKHPVLAWDDWNSQRRPQTIRDLSSSF